MRIAFIVDAFPVLSETFILNQITGLIDKGHDVSIFFGSNSKDKRHHPEVDKYNLLSRSYCYRDRPGNKIVKLIKALGLIAVNLFSHPGVIFRSLNFFKYGKLALSLDLLFYADCFLKHGDFDIMQCHFAPNGELGVLMRDLGIKGKVVTMLHGYGVRKAVKEGSNIYSRLFSGGDVFLSISDYTYKKLLSFGVSPEKIIKHPIGIDISKFPYMEYTDPGKSKFKILTVGRLVPEKGIEKGIRAFDKLIKKADLPDIFYEIVGGGPLEDDLKTLASSLESREKITFTGAISNPEVIEKLYSSDIFFLPSEAEVFPASIMEAQAAGIPVVATDIGGVSELLDGGEAGLLAESGNVNDMADKLYEVLRDGDMRRRISIAGRKNIEDKYNIDKLNSRLICIYEEALSPKSGNV